MRCINCYPLPTDWDWAAKALDFSTPDPIIRGVPGGDPVVIQTIAQPEASNATLPILNYNEDAQKAEPAIAQPDVNPAMQQKPKATSPSPKQQNLPSVDPGKRTDFRLLGWTAPPPPSSSGPPVASPLQVGTLPEGDFVW